MLGVFQRAAALAASSTVGRSMVVVLSVLTPAPGLLLAWHHRRCQEAPEKQDVGSVM